MNIKHHSKRFLHNTNQLLNSPLAVIIVLLLLFAYFAWGNHQFLSQNRTLLINTNKTTQNTNDIVHGQTDILNAIKKLANDTKLDSNEKTNIIICMLQVPVAARTDDLQTQCRKQVESQLDEQSTSSTSTTSSSSNTQSSTPSTATTPTTSETNTSTSSNPSTPSTPTSKKLLNCTIDLLGLHIGC